MQSAFEAAESGLVIVI